MLINTLILFLREALPVFIITTLLLVCGVERKMNRQSIVIGLVLGLLFSVLFLSMADGLAVNFDGAGLELLMSSGYFVIYFLLVSLALIKCMQAKRSVIWIFCIVAVLLITESLHGMKFLIYITGYWSIYGAAPALLIGSFLSVGICMSLSVLVYFSLSYCDRNLHRLTSTYILILFASGQLIHATNLLMQVDYFPSSRAIWDTNFLLDESSEMGQLFTAFFAYDATPSFHQLLVYLIALCIPIIVISFYCHSSRLKKTTTE